MSYIIGIPKEIKNGEGRVALVPNDVATLVNQHKLQVTIQHTAGLISGFSDEDYKKAGATVVDTVADLYDQSSLIVKVKEPLPDDVKFLTNRHTLFCYLHLAPNPDLIKILCDAKIYRAIALELVEGNGKFPLLSPMSEIAGKIAIQIAAYCLYTSVGGRGILLGGVAGTPKGQVTILGAGNVGRTAALLAANMGAYVTVFDKNPEALRFTNSLHSSIETRFISVTELENILPITDILIGAVWIPGLLAPKIVSKAMVGLMQKGSVIVDVSVDQGGCIETIKPTTHSNPFYYDRGVIHIGIPNLPGAVPRTSSIILSGTILQYVVQLATTQIFQQDDPLNKALCIEQGIFLHT